MPIPASTRAVRLSETAAARAARKKAVLDALDASAAATAKRYGGLRVPKGVAALVAKRAKAVRAAAGGSVTKPLEDATLSLDAAVRALARLRAPVDAFFERVTVNAPDAGLRANRLKLLNALRTATLAVADFGRIEG